MQLEPDQQIAIIFLCVLVCVCNAIAVTFLGTYVGTVITSLSLAVVALIFAQLENPY